MSLERGEEEGKNARLSRRASEQGEKELIAEDDDVDDDGEGGKWARDGESASASPRRSRRMTTEVR